MARRGRRTSAASIVERLTGTTPAKERVLVILGNLGGMVPPVEAARRLRVSAAMFRRLRAAMLAAALSSLEPRPRGRPMREVPKHAVEIRRLEGQVADLKEELELSRVREEIAILLPWTRRGQKKARRIWRRALDGTPSGSPAA